MGRPDRNYGHSIRSTDEGRNRRRPQDPRLDIANYYISLLPEIPPRFRDDVLRAVLRAIPELIGRETTATSFPQQQWSTASDQLPTESSASFLRAGPMLPSMPSSPFSHGGSAPYRPPSHSQEPFTFGAEPSTSLRQSSEQSQQQSFNGQREFQQDYVLPSSTSLQQSSSSMQPFAPDLRMDPPMMQNLPWLSTPSMSSEQSFAGEEPRTISSSLIRKTGSLNIGLTIEEEDDAQADFKLFDFGAFFGDCASMDFGQMFDTDEPPPERPSPVLNLFQRDVSLALEQDINAHSESSYVLDAFPFGPFDGDNAEFSHTEKDGNGDTPIVDHFEPSHIFCEGCPGWGLAFQNDEATENTRFAEEAGLGAPIHRVQGVETPSESARANPVKQALLPPPLSVDRVPPRGHYARPEKPRVYADGGPVLFRLSKDNPRAEGVTEATILGHRAPTERMIKRRQELEPCVGTDLDFVLFPPSDDGTSSERVEESNFRGGFRSNELEFSQQPSTPPSAFGQQMTTLRRSPRRHEVPIEHLATNKPPRSSAISTKSSSLAKSPVGGKMATVKFASTSTAVSQSTFPSLSELSHVSQAEGEDLCEPNKKSPRRPVAPKKKTPPVSRKRKAEDEDLNSSPSKKAKPAGHLAPRRGIRRRPKKNAVYKRDAVAVIDGEKKITLKYADAENAKQQAGLKHIMAMFGPPFHDEDQKPNFLPPHRQVSQQEVEPDKTAFRRPATPKRKTAAVSRKRKAEDQDLNSSPSKKPKPTVPSAPRRRNPPRPKKTAGYKRDAVAVTHHGKKITLKYADAENVKQEGELSQVIMFGGENQNHNFIPLHWQAPIPMSISRTSTTTAPVFGYPTRLRSSFHDTVSSEDHVQERRRRASESVEERIHTEMMREDFGVGSQEEGVGHFAGQGPLRARADSGIDLGEDQVVDHSHGMNGIATTVRA